jgi:hypothetical protein
MFGTVKLIIKNSNQSGGGLSWTDHIQDISGTDIKYKIIKDDGPQGQCDLILEKDDFELMNRRLQEGLNNHAAKQFSKVRDKELHKIEKQREKSIKRLTSNYESTKKSIEMRFKKETQFELNAANKLLKVFHKDFDLSKTVLRNISSVDQYKPIEKMISNYLDHIKSLTHNITKPKTDEELRIKGWFGSTTKSEALKTESVEQWISSEIEKHIREKKTNLEQAQILMDTNIATAQKEYNEGKKRIDEIANKLIEESLINATIDFKNIPATFVIKGESKENTGVFKAKLMSIMYGRDNNNINLQYKTNKWKNLTLSMSNVCTGSISQEEERVESRNDDSSNRAASSEDDE